MMVTGLTYVVTICAYSLRAAASAPSGPWDDFNYAPASRTVYPTSVYETSGDVSNVGSLVSSDSGPATLSAGSWLTLDFGKEVGGVISLNLDAVDSEDVSIALAFTESSLFVNPTLSDDSAASATNMSTDGVLAIPAPLSTGLWTQPILYQRGGFRYLTISLTTGDSVSISNVTCDITFMPHVDDLRDYTGYFYAPDPSSEDQDLLSKIWYAGAYTIQTNIIAADSGRTKQYESWNNSGIIAETGPVLVDGAKRDRTVWPGDMGISGPAAFVSLNDLVSVRNSLDEMFLLQNASNGGLPYCGPLISKGSGISDTYHEWTLVGAYNYWLHSGDTDWITTKWDQYVAAVAYLTAKVDSDVGLLNATGSTDWGRLGGGGFSIAPNALYYKVLLNSADIATALGDADIADGWLEDAASLKAVINDALWDDDAGLFLDNTTTTSLHPQDGNSLAVWFNATADDRKTRISEGLTLNWVEVGAVAPELPDTVAPFAGSMEVHAHFAAGEAERALDLIRLQWGWMLTTNTSVESTFLEGYTSNGSLLYRGYAGYDNDPTYTSHSHGWSTGPTPALTTYVLGLTMTEPGGQAFRVEPQTAGLPEAEGGFETPLGWFGVSWAVGDDGAGFELNVTAPEGTRGVAVLPVDGDVTVDGEMVSAVGREVELAGGTHVVSVSSA